MKMHIVSALAVAATLMFGPSAARADSTSESSESSLPSTPSAPSTSPKTAAPPTVWYGHQVLTADLASIGMIVVGAYADRPSVAWIGVGGLAVGAPLVHVAHDRPGAALGSLGLRLTLPVLGAALGRASAGTCTERPDSPSLLGDCFLHGVGEAAVGGMIGLGIASAVDAGFLSHEESKPGRPLEGPRVASIAPSVDPRTGTTSLNLAGIF